jgi:hypothetical protein
MGVAQITRSRERTFIASLCSVKLFSISSSWTHSALREHPSRPFALFGCRFRFESSTASDRIHRKNETRTIDNKLDRVGGHSVNNTSSSSSRSIVTRAKF